MLCAQQLTYCLHSFDQSMAYLRQPEVIRSGKTFVDGVNSLINSRLVNPVTQQPTARINVRVVLAVFVAINFPSQFFGSMGVNETRLRASAVALKQHMHNLAGVLQTASTYADVPIQHLETFVLLMCNYFRDFNEWKTLNTDMLRNRLQRALTLLYDVRAHHQQQGALVSEEQTIPIESNINSMRTKLMQVYGQQALDEFDAQMATRVVPDQRFALTALNIAKEVINNENMAYELLLDENFQLKIEDGTSNSRSVTTLVDSFYDMLLDDLRSDQPSFMEAIRVMNAIRDGFCEFLTPDSALHAEAHALIDMASIIESGLLLSREAGVRLFDDIVALMRQVQTQARSDETQERWELLRNDLLTTASEQTTEIVCNILKFLHSRIDAMRIDAANARIVLIAPVIKEHGVHYIREKFEAKHPNLSKTMQWLSQQVNETNVHQLAQRDRAAVEAVHRSALIDYIIAPDPATLPEVLILDVYRIDGFNEQFKMLVDNATLMHVIEQWVIGGESDGCMRNVEQQALLNVVSDMVLAHSATTEEDIISLHGFIEQIVPGLVGSSSAGLLQEMQKALSPTYEGRALV
jgi:hypothetical protein